MRWAEVVWRVARVYLNACLSPARCGQHASPFGAVGFMSFEQGAGGFQVFRQERRSFITTKKSTKVREVSRADFR